MSSESPHIKKNNIHVVDFIILLVDDRLNGIGFLFITDRSYHFDI